MPTIVNANTNIPSIVIGEKAADLDLKGNHDLVADMTDPVSGPNINPVRREILP